MLNELRSAAPVETPDAVGKLVEDYVWYFCCEADKSLADSLKAGETYTLHFSYAPQQDIPALLESIVVSGEDGYVLTFSSTYITDEILLLRSHTAAIVRSKYEGLRIRNEARRVIDGQVGVFVRSGLTFEFCPSRCCMPTRATPSSGGSRAKAALSSSTTRWSSEARTSTTARSSHSVTEAFERALRLFSPGSPAFEGRALPAVRSHPFQRGCGALRGLFVRRGFPV